MMMCEFIERTGFEPTAAEYAEIEAEYMGCDVDKDVFCRNWKRNGGIQRLSRIRARRIEELEQQLRTAHEQYDRMDSDFSRKYNDVCKQNQELRQQNEVLEARIEKIKSYL